MIAIPSSDDTLRFRETITRRLGLYFDDTKLDDLAQVLRRHLEAARVTSTGAYLETLSTSELSALAESLTINETYFFRYSDHFRAFVDVVLDAAIRSGKRRLRVLSAGCASGEEPYSLAMLMREHIPDLSSWTIDLRAVDVNPAVIAKAKHGVYGAWALRETTRETADRHFVKQDAQFTIDRDLQGMVKFSVKNLVDDDAELWKPESYDVVFCRNVIMYFSPEAMAAVIARITRALAPGGYLFLGHAETLRGLSHAFHLRHTHATFYYQLRDDDERSVPSRSPERANVQVAPMTELPSTSWIEIIQRASDRVAELANARAAKTHVLAVKESDTVDLETRLLRAVVLTNAGRLREAEEACGALLASDEMNAGAHYLMALCREHAGDRDGALEHDRTAAYIERAFAMPHIHAGILERRAGNAKLAREELSRALALLVSEDDSRIVLFGGGFSREALVTLCKLELRRCGESA